MAAQAPTITCEASVEHRSQELLAPLWATLDDQPHYPLNTSEVLALCLAAGYDCSARRLNHWIASGQLPTIPVKGHGPGTGQVGVSRKWRANDVVTLFALLESRRYWLPGRHADRKSIFQIQYEKCPEETRLKLFPDLDKFTLDELLVFATTERQEIQREALYIAIKLKLEQLGVDTKGALNND